jgi:hypothetical protein
VLLLPLLPLAAAPEDNRSRDDPPALWPLRSSRGARSEADVVRARRTLGPCEDEDEEEGGRPRGSLELDRSPEEEEEDAEDDDDDDDDADDDEEDDGAWELCVSAAAAVAAAAVAAVVAAWASSSLGAAAKKWRLRIRSAALAATKVCCPPLKWSNATF